MSRSDSALVGRFRFGGIKWVMTQGPNFQFWWLALVRRD
jgi:hypothetical protein